MLMDEWDLPSRVDARRVPGCGWLAGLRLTAALGQRAFERALVISVVLLFDKVSCWARTIICSYNLLYTREIL